jgi:hypothetical protein
MLIKILWGKSDNNNNVQQPVVSQGSKTVQPSVTVTRQAPRHIFSLDSNLDNSDVVDNFNLILLWWWSYSSLWYNG